jgi:hypothetical protein
MMTKKRSGALLASSVSLLFAACGPMEGAPGDETELVRAPLTNGLDEDGIVTNFGAQVAIAAGTISEIVVWTGTDTKVTPNVPTLAVQGFSQTGDVNVTQEGVVARRLSTTGRPVSQPAIAWDNTNVGDTFLAVWQDDFSQWDSDIWGALTTNDGKLVPGSPFHINFDSLLERAPNVMWVPSQNKFLVTYRQTSGNNTALVGNWVSAGGDVGPTTAIVGSGVTNDLTVTKHTTSLVPSNDKFLLTYNENKYAFYSASTLAIVGSTQTANGATGIQGSANTTGTSYALAWRAGTGSGAQIRVKFFRPGCFDPNASCGKLSVVVQTGPGLTNPVISPFNASFAAFYGQGEEIGVGSIDTSGNFFQGNTAIITDCSGANPGQPFTMAAATPPNPGSGDRAYLLYDTFCSSLEKERVVATSPVDVDDFFEFNTSN